MKNFTLLFLIAFTLGSYAQVTVKEQSVNIDGSKNGFYISVPYGTQKQVEKELKEELKSWKGNYSKKSTIFVDDCKIKEMGKNTFDVFAKVEENSDGGAFVSVAVDLGGAFMSSSEHSTQAKIITSRLQKFGVSAAKSVIDDEIKAEEKILKDQQNELSDFEKEQEKLEKEIEDFKKKIADNEKAIETAKKNQEDKKGEIKEQEEKVKTVIKKKEAVK